MLLQATMGISLFAMCTTLWLGFYLFARGFPRILTLRVVVVMLALSGFFYAAYNNIFEQKEGGASIRAALLIIVLVGWYSVTFHVMSDANQKSYRFFKWGIYILGLLSIVYILQPNTFLFEKGNALYVAHMNPKGWAYRIYGGYQLIVSFGIMLNLLIGDRVGLTSQGKYFFITSIFPVISVIYGVVSLGSPKPAPRIIQDTLAFCGVVVLGFSVARYQAMTERRTTYQDFPLTTFSTLGLVALASLMAYRSGMEFKYLASVAGFAVLVLGLYDLTREFLERKRTRDESLLRKQFRQLDSSGEEALKSQLQSGLELLCETLDAPGGFAAIRRGDEFLVMASRYSIQTGSVLKESAVACEDVSRPSVENLSSVAWIAPSFEGHTQVAVLGIERPNNKIEYSAGNLELLAEVADHVGTLVSFDKLQTSTKDTSIDAKELIASVSSNTDADFVKMVEDALRHLSDTIILGQSPLVARMGIQAKNHVECGKKLQQTLIDAVELLKPDKERPPEPLPRNWYNFVVLHDAYIEGVQNREIMARLYISEGTFNRTRRNAIRGLTRMLGEKAGK